VIIMADMTSGSRVRPLLFWVGVILAVQAVAALAFASRSPATDGVTTRPVTFDQLVLLQVDIRVGVIVLLSFFSLAFLTLSTTAMFPSDSRQLSQNPHPARWLIFSLTSSISVFLVAQLNGITDIGTLVLLYAATSAMTLFTVLQERESRAGSSNMLPMSFGTAIGIVPWGIIAFHEIVGGIVGGGPSLTVRLITLMMLAFAITFTLSQWGEQRRIAARRDSAGEQIFVVLSAVSTSIFAWAVLLTLA